MRAADELRRFLSRYGQTATLIKEGEKQPVKALIHPVCSAGGQPAGEAGILGLESGRLYEYIGLIAPDRGALLQGEDGSRYEVLQSEEVRLTGKRLYVWAALRRMEGTA